MTCILKDYFYQNKVLINLTYLILAEIIHQYLILIVKLLYNLKCPSVYPSICKTQCGGIVIFSAPIQDTHH